MCAGAPRVLRSSAVLPVRLILKPMLPVKNATHKLTIDTNKSAVNLGELFSGLLCAVVVSFTRFNRIWNLEYRRLRYDVTPQNSEVITEGLLAWTGTICLNFHNFLFVFQICWAEMPNHFQMQWASSTMDWTLLSPCWLPRIQVNFLFENFININPNSFP